MIRTNWIHVIGLVILVLANNSTALGTKCAVWTPHCTCLHLFTCQTTPCASQKLTVCVYIFMNIWNRQGNTFCIYATEWCRLTNMCLYHYQPLTTKVHLYHKHCSAKLFFPVSSEAFSKLNRWNIFNTDLVRGTRQLKCSVKHTLIRKSKKTSTSNKKNNVLVYTVRMEIMVYHLGNVVFLYQKNIWFKIIL